VTPQRRKKQKTLQKGFMQKGFNIAGVASIYGRAESVYVVSVINFFQYQFQFFAA